MGKSLKNPLQQYTDKLHTQTTAKATNSIPPKRPWHSIRLEEYRHLIQAFFLLAFLYVLGISAILRADFNYIDDLGRVAQGYKDWDGFSRYLSNFLSTFLHTDQYLTDISPLPQLVSAFLLSAAGMVILSVLGSQKNISPWEIIALIPLGLSPYFLECISYKYDSPYMALSILASVFPLLFYKRGALIYGSISILGILTVCTTYQPAAGIYPMLVILVSLQFWNRNANLQKILKFISISAASYLIGMMAFRFLLMRPVDNYVSGSLPPLPKLIPQTLEHFKTYFLLVNSDFKKEWMIFLILMAAAFVLLTVRDSRQKKWLAFLLSGAALIAMALLSFGIYPLLENPLYAPRAMYGFGVFVALMGVSIARAKRAYAAKTICFCLSWCLFVFSFTYGNALSAQKNYTDFRIELAIADLNTSMPSPEEGEKTVQIAGSIGFAPVINHMPIYYQSLLHRLVPVLFQEEWDWGIYQFYNYYGLRNVRLDRTVDLTEMNLPVLKDTMYHTIRGKGNNVLIELKPSNP